MRAVLDWELCTVGDPLADVGLMVAYWTEMAAAAQGEDALFPEPVTALPGFPGPRGAGGRVRAGLRARSRRARLLGGVRVLEGRNHRRGRLSDAGSTTRRTARPRSGCSPPSRVSPRSPLERLRTRRTGVNSAQADRNDRIARRSGEGSLHGAHTKRRRTATTEAQARREAGADHRGRHGVLRPDRLRGHEVGRRRRGGRDRIDCPLPLLRVEAALPVRDHGRGGRRTSASASSGSPPSTTTGPRRSSPSSSTRSTSPSSRSSATA